MRIKKNNDKNHGRRLSNLSKLHMPKIRNGRTENVSADGLGRVHTYRNIFESATLSLLMFGFRPHMSNESGIPIRNFLNPLSRVEIFECAKNPESCGR